MARVTKDYAFGYDNAGVYENGSIPGVVRYGDLVVISSDTAFQLFVTNETYSDILLWAAPSDDPDGEYFGYFIAYTSSEPRSTPVEEVDSNVGFLRASNRYGVDGENDLLNFINSRFEDGGESGAQCQAFLTENGMWSNFGLDYA